MSIYSGFATRNQEQYYDKMIYNLISTLLLRIVKFYKRQTVDQNIFIKIIYQQERSMKKIEKRKYLDPKYSQLLTAFKKQMTQEEDGIQTRRQNIQKDKQIKDRSRAKETQIHQMNRTLSLLGRQFSDLRANAQKLDRSDFEEQESQHNQSLAKIQQQRKRQVSKRKHKEKKSSIKSNLDIWEVRQEKPPQLPSLHPLHNLHKTIMSKTKFNNFSQKMRSKQLEQRPNDEQPDSLKNVLTKPPKFRAKMYFN